MVSLVSQFRDSLGTGVAGFSPARSVDLWLRFVSSVGQDLAMSQSLSRESSQMSKNSLFQNKF
jgi:hypothetical protein